MQAVYLLITAQIDRIKAVRFCEKEGGGVVDPPIQSFSSSISFEKLRTPIVSPVTDASGGAGEVQRGRHHRRPQEVAAAQTGTRPDKIRIQKWYNIYKDHITLKDYEIHDGMGLELYYN
ncbi:hypothetical protein ABZP36_033399 [Zizania latifolia]